MRILILGNNGRTHALAWNLLNSANVGEVVCAPGNGGTALLMPSIDLGTHTPRVAARWCFDEAFDLILPSDSAVLHNGLYEEAHDLHIGVCGSPQQTVALEYSRCRAKAFLLRHNLPTAPGRAFSDQAMAEKFLAAQALPVMIKADHPNNGEAVFHDRYQALAGVKQLFENRSTDDTQGVVIEEVLSGPRVVMSALSDGRMLTPLLPVRLYDRIGEGDTGEYAPAIGVHTGSSAFARQLGDYMHRRLLQPLADGLAADGLALRGFFGVDCIITDQGPRISALRFSMHEGEAQAILPRLTESIYPWIQAAAGERLHELPAPTWTPTPSVGIGLMARGYPRLFPSGGSISGLEDLDEGVRAFHHDTANPAARLPYTPRLQRTSNWGAMIGNFLGMTGPSVNALHTTGGLPLMIVAQAATLAGARGRALINADRIRFEGCTYRGDIGAKEFA